MKYEIRDVVKKKKKSTAFCYTVFQCQILVIVGELYATFFVAAIKSGINYAGNILRIDALKKQEFYGKIIVPLIFIGCGFIDCKFIFGAVS